MALPHRWMAEFGLPGAAILLIVSTVVGPFGTKREYGGEGENHPKPWLPPQL